MADPQMAVAATRKHTMEARRFAGNIRVFIRPSATNPPFRNPEKGAGAGSRLDHLVTERHHRRRPLASTLVLTKIRAAAVTAPGGRPRHHRHRGDGSLRSVSFGPHPL